MNFRIKICGITSTQDALKASAAGADAIGLNFYKKSPRCVDLSEAERIRDALANKVCHAGVFVNATKEEIAAIGAALELRLIQLHGDEPPKFLAEMARDVEIIRARRLDDRGTDAIIEDLESCRVAGRSPDAILVDAALPGQFGGTGQKADWHQLQHRDNLWQGKRLILAGGLTPENVAEAIRIVRPQGVDVASGVESRPGVKDAAKMRDFVSAAREAFGR